MKVKELIERLSGFNGELNVILQKDSEGNGYSPLSDADDNGMYVAETTYSGDMYDKNDPECTELGGENVVVLWPKN